LDVIKEQSPTVKISSRFNYSLLKKAEMIETAKKLISRSHKFKLLLESLRLPLRYAVISLLSNHRVSIFNETLVPFLQLLVQSSKWNDSDKYADYGSFLIDKLSFELDPFNRPQQDLTKAFQAQLAIPANMDQFRVLLDHANENSMLQRKVFVTPTMVKVSLA